MNNKNLNTYHKLPFFDGLELLHAKNHTVNFPFHTHNTFNIALILDQTFYTKLNDKFLQAPIGTLSITNPNEVHATPCEEKIGNSFFTFYISPEVLNKLNKNQPVFFEDKIIYDPDLFNKLYYLSQNFASPVLNFERELLAVLKNLVFRYAITPAFKNKEINLFFRFLNDEPFEKFSLENTAKSFGLDKYKFLRLFKQETGLTPNSYVILKRIEKCKALLKTNDDLLSIAVDTGFYDIAHLCKDFKRFTGVTPLEYKNS